MTRFIDVATDMPARADKFAALNPQHLLKPLLTIDKRTYAYYRSAFAGQNMPFAFADLDLLEENAKQIIRRAKGKSIRIASKSVRCRELLRRILEMSPSFKGIMCFALPEAIFLSRNGFDDLLAAYPCMQREHIENVCKEVKKGKKITLMVDDLQHALLIDQVAAAQDAVIPVCMDIDMSSDFPGLHFGVWRSGLSGRDKAMRLLEGLLKLQHIRITGLMGYEAQIAGVGDNYPGRPVKNALVRALKKISARQVLKRRKEITEAICAEGINLSFVNGGGTGSLETTASEEAVTEVTAGSGFYSSALFDNYSDFRHLPAAGFAIEVTRNPSARIYTCHGGGYVASGSAGADKLPSPYLPEGLRLIKNEGAGEVQTPLVCPEGLKLSLGNPVFMRHGKAGELCERFNELILVSQGRVAGKVNTYRGEGKCFV